MTTLTVDIKKIEGCVKPLTDCTNDLNANLDISYVVLGGRQAGYDEDHESRVKVRVKAQSEEILEAQVVISILRQIYGRCLAYDLPIINGMTLRLNQKARHKLGKQFKDAQPTVMYVEQVGVLNHSIGNLGERHGNVFISYRLSGGGICYRVDIDTRANKVSSYEEFKDAIRKAVGKEAICFETTGEAYLRAAYTKWLERK